MLSSQHQDCFETILFTQLIIACSTILHCGWAHHTRIRVIQAYHAKLHFLFDLQVMARVSCINLHDLYLMRSKTELIEKFKWTFLEVWINNFKVIKIENLLFNKSLVSLLHHLLFYSNRSYFFEQLKKMFHLNQRNKLSLLCFITTLFSSIVHVFDYAIPHFIQIEYQ